ncbi:MAG: aspartate/glutamate racemase family protein [Bacillota bacterium]
MSRILVLTPIVGPEFNERVKTYVSRIQLPEGVTADCVCLEQGPVSVETMFDEAFAAAACINRVMELTERERYAAVVVNCCADPAVHALREALVDVPVVGAGEASYYTAALLAPSFSVVSVLRNSVPHTKLRIRAMGLEARLASVYGIDTGVLDLGGESAADQILKAAEQAVRHDAADCVVLGCTGMADLAEKIRARLPVPVVEPTAAAVWQALALMLQGLAHGRAWMYLRADRSKIK